VGVGPRATTAAASLIGRWGPSLLILAATAVHAGCATAREPVKDDEAMARARCNRPEDIARGCTPLTPEDAAAKWFPPSPVDYFPGMDQVVVSPGAVTDDSSGGEYKKGEYKKKVDTLQTPVYQLLDKNDPALRDPPAVLTEPYLTEGEIKGRNAWMMWAGGNEGFWNWLSTEFGFIDLLTLIDTRQRARRFADAGMINEPGMTQAGEADEFGLWLDQPIDPDVRAWRRDYLKKAFASGSSTSGPGGSYGSYGSSAAHDERQSHEHPAAGAPTSVEAAPSGGAYGKDAAYGNYAGKVPPPAVYGLSSGVIGLRLFPNPHFDAKARRAWDEARKQSEDPIRNPALVRPYRVGMACAFCHTSFHPLKPPRDLTAPQWENISGNIGAQYLRPRAVFGNLLPKDNFIYHVLDSQPPGTIDTSLIASDNLNNPNTMNAVFKLPQRAIISFLNPKEKISATSATQPSLWRHPEANPPAGADDVTPEYWRQLFEKLKLGDELRDSNNDLRPGPRRTPRILLDGADSIGGWGALARVYLNIGTHWEHWNQLHLPVAGFRPQEPFRIDSVAKHSVYWHATQLRVPHLRDYFLKVTPAMPLVEAKTIVDPAPAPAPSTDAAATGATEATGASGATATAAQPAEAADRLKDRFKHIDTSKLALGRKVFARNCIVCHSSIQPDERFAEMEKFAQAGEFWDHDPARWLSDPEYLRWAEKEVEKPDFWRLNYLSTDYRIAVNLVETNSCRALATNALTGHMWQDFASESYRQMPSVGSIGYFNPFLGKDDGRAFFSPGHHTAPGVPSGGGGPGFYRVPSLVSIWATAPFLHNNSLGLFNNDPSIDGRLAAFDDAIRKLLWPSRRLQSSSYNDATRNSLRRDHGLIWRTTQETYLHFDSAYVPRVLGMQAPIVRMLRDRLPWIREIPRKYWPLPSGVLFLVALVVLWRASRLLTRLIGYAVILIAVLAGGLIYFLNGGAGDLHIGPIPAGTPVNLIANVNPEADPDKLKRALRVATETLTEIESTQVPAEERWKRLTDRIAPELIAVSKCPDLVMDRGHDFKWFKQMTDADKNALIELLKTF
jgi:mono/diheme cytochrome c family protein